MDRASYGVFCFNCFLANLTIHSRGTAIVPMSVPLTQALGQSMDKSSNTPILWGPIARIVWAFTWRGLLISLVIGFVFGLLGAIVGPIFGLDPNLSGKYASYFGSFLGFSVAVATLIDDTFGGYQLRLTKL